MATIFQKLPASGENCIILEPKESLIYPFEFGNWNEIRITTTFSCTSLSDNNASWVNNDSVSYVSGQNQTNAFLYGICSSGFIPERTGTFIGCGPDGVSRSLIITNFSNGIFFGGVNTYYAGTIFNNIIRSAGSIGAFSFSTQVETSGVANYAGYSSIGIKISNRGNSNQSYAVAERGGGSITDVSIPKLRQYSSQILESDYLTGVFTSDGVALPIPDRLFIYCPLQQNRLRVHSIVIEKYA